MDTSTQGGRTRLALLRIRMSRIVAVAVAVVVVLVESSFALQGSNDSKDETFELVDPYTTNQRTSLERAGYVGFGPFPLWDGVRTSDVEEAIGRKLLWVETAHFKLGTTLETYKSAKGDPREEKRSKEELKRLEPKFAKFKPTAGKVDPWLRLHLYAQRLEEQHTEFVKTFSLTPEDFATENEKVPFDAPRGQGPYLGQVRKAVVLLLEKQSHFGRVNTRWFTPVDHQSARLRMPGGGMLLITCAETLVKWGYEQDAALHSVVAADVVYNFVDGLRDHGYWSPLWFKTGLAHIASRKVDEKLAIYAFRSVRQHDTDAWKWEPRVLGLVANDYVPKWAEMAAFTSWDQLTGPGHMVAWSRVTWLLGQRGMDLKSWLFGITEPFHDLKGDARARALRAREVEVTVQVFAKNFAEMDAAWRRWVHDTYKR